MPIITKLFVVGDPGSGKSTVFHECIEPIIRGYQRTPIHFNDYKILHEMFLEDSQWEEERRRFKPSEYGGFTVLKFEVFDEALQKLEQGVKAEVDVVNETLPSHNPPFVLIEFARNDYKQAFQQFSNDFLQDTHVIYLDTEVSTCEQRIKKRIKKPENERTTDDYFVSGDIFETYYSKKQKHDLVEVLTEFDILSQRILIINNNDTLQAVSRQIELFTHSIFASPHEEHNKPIAPSRPHSKGPGKLLYLALF